MDNYEFEYTYSDEEDEDADASSTQLVSPSKRSALSTSAHDIGSHLVSGKLSEESEVQIMDEDAKGGEAEACVSRERILGFICQQKRINLAVQKSMEGQKKTLIAKQQDCDEQGNPEDDEDEESSPDFQFRIIPSPVLSPHFSDQQHPSSDKFSTDALNDDQIMDDDDQVDGSDQTDYSSNSFFEDTQSSYLDNFEKPELKLQTNGSKEKVDLERQNGRSKRMNGRALNQIAEKFKRNTKIQRVTSPATNQKTQSSVQRAQYEDVVRSSKPMFIVQLYYKHYIKIFLAFMLLFAFTGYMMVTQQLFRVQDFVIEDILIRGSTLTNQYFVGRKATNVKNFKYVEYFDEVQREGSLVLANTNGLQSLSQKLHPEQIEQKRSKIKVPTVKTEKMEKLYQDVVNEQQVPDSAELEEPLSAHVQLLMDEIDGEDFVPSIVDWILHGSSRNRDEKSPVKKPLPRDQSLNSDLRDLTIIYECKDDCQTIVDSEHIIEMERFVKLALDDELWGKMCRVSLDQQAQDGQGCTDSAFQNITRFIYPFIDSVTNPDHMIQDFIKIFVKNDHTYSEIRHAVGNDFSRENPNSKYMVAQFNLAMPLRESKWHEDNSTVPPTLWEEVIRELDLGEAEDTIKQFHQNVYDKAKNFKSDILRVRMVSVGIYNKLKQDALAKDIRLAFSIIIISLVFICFHVGSLFIGITVVVQIFFSIPISLVIYKDILKIDYFCQLHLFIVVIILGIGADDVFVFHDQWMHAKHIKVLKNKIVHRMAYTMRKASSAMLITSVTTAASFLATGISPIMPLVSFGIFSALVVVVNYILIITVLPSVYFLYDRHVSRHFRCFHALKLCFIRLLKRRIQKRESGVAMSLLDSNVEANESLIDKHLENGQGKTAKSQNGQVKKKTNKLAKTAFKWEKQQLYDPLPLIPEQEGHNIDYSEYNVAVKGFINTFFDQYLSKWIYKQKKLIMVASAIWFAASIYMSANLDMDESSMQFFKDSVPIQQSIDIVDNELYHGDELIRIHFIFGVKDKLYHMGNESHSFWESELSGHPIFDIEFDLSPEENQLKMLELCDVIRKSEYRAAGVVECPIEQIKRNVESKQIPFPIPREQFDEAAKQLFYEENPGALLYHDEKIRGYVISFNGQPIRGKSYEEKIKIFESFNNIAKEIERQYPMGINQVWQLSDAEWAVLQLQNSLFSNAMQGMACSIIFAFLVLIVTTKNYTVSIFAICSISLVICSIMATIYLCKWGIGTSESLALIIFVGFSVDYVVHMCHQYVDSVHDKRVNRVESCFQKIGVTLVNGAITSFSAGLLLYFCQFSSLHKFGVFMMTTIASALFFSLLFYPALSYSFGPEFKQGDVIHNIANPIKKWLRERKLQRIRESYKRFQKRFYRRQFDQDAEDDGTLETEPRMRIERKLRIIREGNSTSIDLVESCREFESREWQPTQLLKSLHWLQKKLSRKNQERMLVLYLKYTLRKMAFRVQKDRMGRLLEEDLRYFRRQIAYYYESARDKYDEVYLFMDRFGNELKGNRLEQHVIQSTLEEQNFDKALKDIIPLQYTRPLSFGTLGDDVIKLGSHHSGYPSDEESDAVSLKAPSLTEGMQSFMKHRMNKQQRQDQKQFQTKMKTIYMTEAERESYHRSQRELLQASEPMQIQEEAKVPTLDLKQITFQHSDQKLQKTFRERMSARKINVARIQTDLSLQLQKLQTSMQRKRRARSRSRGKSRSFHETAGSSEHEDKSSSAHQQLSGPSSIADYMSDKEVLSPLPKEVSNNTTHGLNQQNETNFLPRLEFDAD